MWQWSIDNLSEFWSLVWEYCEVISSRAWTEVLPAGSLVDEIPRWFTGALLNYAENLLQHNQSRADAVALTVANEREESGRRLTFGELKEQTGRMANALKAIGVAKGSVVAMYAPNLPEAVVFTLAAASIGAIVTAVSPDFGPEAVLDRFAQTQPVVLLTADAALYNGKVHGHWEKVKGVLAGCPSIKNVVWIRVGDGSLPVPDVKECKFTEYPKFLSRDATLMYEQLPFDHPLFILYSSGTTGKPKCLVHSAGGTLLQHLKEHRLHADLGPGDRLLQYTTLGWMMWQWQLSALGVGCSLVLYDGSPFRPDDSHLLRVLAANGVTAFGTSAKYLQRLEETGTAPDGLDLARLKIVFSTGSPLPSNTFDWVADRFGSPMIASITGGTDIISLFAGGCPVLPVYSGLIQCRCLGMAVYAYDHSGSPVYDEPGDLVCTRPFPCQPVFFWNDTPDRAAYRKAYFSSDWPHIWHHGDFIEICSSTGGVLMLGRSDGTLNPAGVRFGSADLYAVLGASEFRGLVSDALAVGVRRQGDPDERVFLFLQLPDQSTDLPAGLEDRIRKAIRARLSPRHVPAIIMACPLIPYTLNGKKVEVAVKRILSGFEDHAPNTGSLANPEALDFFRSLAHQQL